MLQTLDLLLEIISGILEVYGFALLVEQAPHVVDFGYAHLLLWLPLGIDFGVFPRIQTRRFMV